MSSLCAAHARHTPGQNTTDICMHVGLVQGRLGDRHLLMHMLQHDSALQASLDCYRNNYIDCTVKMHTTPSCEKEHGHRQMQQHIQTFLYEATTYYFAVGFVVFRFHKMPQQQGTTLLVPAVVPLGDIEWCYTGETDSLLQIPEIEVPRCNSGETPRFYVYKFRSTGQYTSVDSCGVLSRLTQNYRRLVHARDYDLIIRNENLRKTFFIEQAVKSNVDVLTQGSKAAEYGELQAIMDYTRGHRATTHSAIPPTQNEEVKQGILVPVVWCGGRPARALLFSKHSARPTTPPGPGGGGPLVGGAPPPPGKQRVPCMLAALQALSQ